MSELVTSLSIIFVGAALALLISYRLERPSIPLYIVAGFLASGFVSGEQVLNLSQLGISFLVFVYGVRFDTGKLASVAPRAFAASTVSVTALGALSGLLGIMIGFNLVEAVVFSAAAALSSSLVGLELIRDELRKELLHGRLTESIQLLQDMVGVALLLVLFSSSPFISLVKGLLLFLMAFALKYVVPEMAEGFRESSEAVMVFSIAVLALFVSFTRFMDVSIVVGAFAAGISLSRHPFSLEVLDTIGTLKDFFTALLFVSIGILAFTTGLEALMLSLLIVVLTSLVKPLITFFSLEALGEGDRVSFLSSLGVDQVSEFAVIIAIQALVAGEVSSTLFQSVVLATAFTMSLSSFTARNDNRIYELFSGKFLGSDDIESNFEEKRGHIVLVGYDVQGKQILRKLERTGEDVVVVEYDPEKVEELKERDSDYVYGDVMHMEAWNESDYRQADLIVSTVPLRHISDHIISLSTEAEKILRAPDASQAVQLLNEGAMFVSVPKLLASQRLTEHLEGVLNDPGYIEELRRKKLLELRKDYEED